MIRETNERIFPGSFYLNLIIRLSVFSLTALVVIIAVINISKEYLIISLNLVLLLVFQVISLYRFISKIDKDLVRAFTAIRYNEFSDSIRDQKGNRGFERFRELINEMNSIIKDKSKEIRSKEILLRDTIEFSPGALIIFDKDGRVVNINKAATRLTGINKLTNIRSLNSLADSLGNRIMDMQPGSPLRLLIDTNTASLKSTGLTLLFNKESFNSDDA